MGNRLRCRDSVRESRRSPEECDAELQPSLAVANCAAKDVILWSKGATAAITMSRIMDAISGTMVAVAGGQAVDGFDIVCAGEDAGAVGEDADAAAGGEHADAGAGRVSA